MASPHAPEPTITAKRAVGLESPGLILIPDQCPRKLAID